jgi:hypothetical protein
MHTSHVFHGVDVADITNDGYPEIISMDMLPSDPLHPEAVTGEDEYTTFYMKIGMATSTSTPVTTFSELPQRHV